MTVYCYYSNNTILQLAQEILCLTHNLSSISHNTIFFWIKLVADSKRKRKKNIDIKFDFIDGSGSAMPKLDSVLLEKEEKLLKWKDRR